MDKNTLSALRAKAFKYRGGVWTALFVVILALAHPVPGPIPAGIVLVVLGQLLRFWGAGCIKRYRGE
ncbi:MAG: isoprenylcysteine carboxylmethyltransferase family protein, partial [Pyramidobacter sp.]|nr:isoprenylcysteine carboxylmethyltransferase family protein [Pyramidobacter sp.]